MDVAKDMKEPSESLNHEEEMSVDEEDDWKDQRKNKRKRNQEKLKERRFKCHLCNEWSNSEKDLKEHRSRNHNVM